AQDCTNIPTCTPSPPTRDSTCIYDPQPITSIAAIGGGVYLALPCVPPNPTRCGGSNGFVLIPANADPSMKALAISLYLSGQRVRIDTNGCTGEYEAVGSVYSR